MSDQQILQILEQYLLTEILVRERAVELTPDFPLMLSGAIDSLGLFKLIAFAETEFKITIQPDEVLLENFETLSAMTALIQTKLQGQTQS